MANILLKSSKSVIYTLSHLVGQFSILYGILSRTNYIIYCILYTGYLNITPAVSQILSIATGY